MPDLDPRLARLDAQEVDDLIHSIHIPPRPSLLADLQQEIDRPDPNLRTLARVVEKDVALSGAFLKTVNSALYHRARKAETVEAALTGLGLNQVSLLAGGFLVRQSFHSDRYELSGFWETSTRRSVAMAYLARELRAGSPDLARSFGLFADLGIPMLMERFGDYGETLRLAHCSMHAPFTEVEDGRHRTNHAVIGALLARNWKLPDDVVLAISLHHDYTAFASDQAPLSVRRLIALGAISDIIIQHYMGLALSADMHRAGPLALDELGVGSDELDDLNSAVHDIFNQDA
ncbi:HDOD domain-containing protein [Paludibacterium yongneupense]|uniref:HDOD domain-containing protein n=1 Tax=Paludibacterium yongneupense TaxID=400061 RepID=UPI00048A69B8|nr:HDOD domain-containing protein [Paludibacterium yongneupense]